MKNVYADPSEVFDTILDDEKIIARAQSVTKYYDEFNEAADAYFHRKEGNMRDVKKKMYPSNANSKHSRRTTFLCKFCLYICIWRTKTNGR